MPWINRLRSDRGSAVAEFPLVALLLLLVAFAALQLAILIHVRNSMQDVAVQAAREVSLLGSGPERGEMRAREIIEQRFGSTLPAQITVEDVGGPIVTVTVKTTLPMLGLFGPDQQLIVRGHAYREQVE